MRPASSPMAARGLLISWATPAAMRPNDTSRAECASWASVATRLRSSAASRADQLAGVEDHRPADQQRRRQQGGQLNLAAPAAAAPWTRVGRGR